MKKATSSWWRALFHFSFGFGAMLFAQILGWEEEKRVWIAQQVCFWSFLADVTRVTLHRFLWGETVLKLVAWKLRWSGPLWSTVSIFVVVFKAVRWFLLFFEKWVLLWTHIIREHEEAQLAALTPFALGVLIPLWLGVPSSAVMLGVIILGFGDPIAREWAMHRSKNKKIELHQVFEGGKKTWTGYRGFCASAGMGVLISSLLDLLGFTVFPQVHFVFFLIAFPLGIAVGGYAELAQEWIHLRVAPKISSARWRWLFCFLLDDNSLVPIASSITIGAIFTIGQMAS